jgi:hypothetical protein
MGRRRKRRRGGGKQRRQRESMTPTDQLKAEDQFVFRGEVVMATAVK